MSDFGGLFDAWVAIALCLLILSSQVSTAAEKLQVLGVTGSDNRQISDSRSYPWSAIGRLNITTGGYCTGTVIGPRRVLTAAHCLWNRRTGRWFPPCALHFLSAYRRGEYAVHALVSEVQVVSGFRIDQIESGKDWALLTLDRDVSKQTGIVEMGELSGGAQVRLIQAGYSRDHRHVLTVDPQCRRTGVSRGGDFITHDCDATFGDSGSPILSRHGEGYRLVGIHVAVRRRNQKVEGIAVTSKVFTDWINTHPVTRPPGGVKACSSGAFGPLPEPGIGRSASDRTSALLFFWRMAPWRDDEKTERLGESGRQPGGVVTA